jgi:DNA end-binding protein Ku
MRKEKKVALGRFVLSNREHAVAIAPRGKGLLATTLRDAREILAEKNFFDEIKPAAGDRGLVEIATKIIDQKSGKFDPSEFEDRYESALRAMIERRSRGAKALVEEPSEPQPTNVVDLMAALKASLKGGSPRRASSEGAAGRKGRGKIVPFQKPAAARKDGAARKPPAGQKPRRKSAGR